MTAPGAPPGRSGSLPGLLRTPAFGLLLVLALAAAARWPGLDLPLDRDEGEYATLAQQWSDGALPYRDFLEQKPPLVPLLYLAAYRTFGDSTGGVRNLALIWQLATVAGVWLLMRRLAGGAAGATAGALVAVGSCGVRIQGLTANTETFITAPVVAALLLMMTRSGASHPGDGPPDGLLGSFSRSLAAGALVGVASLAKQPAILLLATFPCLAPGSLTRRVRVLLVAGLGAAVPWAVTLAYFALHGAAGDALYCLVSYNLAYAGQGTAGWLDRVLGAGQALLPEQGGLFLLALLGAVRPRRDLRTLVVPLTAWLAATVLGVLASGRYYPHYFIVTVAPLACLAGLWLVDTTPGQWRRILPRVAGLGLLVGGWTFTGGAVWAAASGPERSVRIFGIPHFAQAPEVAAAVEEADPGGRRLWIWGAEAELFALTRRRPTSRFLFHYPFTGDAPPYPNGETELLAALADPSTRVAVIADRLRLDVALEREILTAVRTQFVPVYRREPYLIVRRR